MKEEPAVEVPTDLELQLAEVIGEKFIEFSGNVNTRADLFELGIDSMGIMRLLMEIEQTFGVRIPGHEVTKDNFRSIFRIAQLLSRVAGRAS